MYDVTVNDEIELSYPDDFKVLTPEEITHYFTSANNRWTAKDNERHLLLSVAWTKPGFISYITDSRSVMKGIESQLKRNMNAFCKIGSETIVLGSHKGHALSYEYRARDKDISQCGELIVFRQKDKFYIIDYIYRKENSAEAKDVLNTILPTIK